MMFIRRYWPLALIAACLAFAVFLAASSVVRLLHGAGGDAEPDHAARIDSVTPCAERVFLAGEGAYSWGSITRSGIGAVSAHHVFAEGRAVTDGPRLAPVRSLEATDFVFLTGSDPGAAPDSVAELAGRVTLEGFPARSGTLERVAGEVYAPDTIPPGVWVVLDHPEPLVGGFSGGCVRDAAGEVVAVIMGASSMNLDGETRHFGRVIPIRAALSEAQGTPPGIPATSLMGRPLPEAIADWDARSPIGGRF